MISALFEFLFCPQHGILAQFVSVIPCARQFWIQAHFYFTRARVWATDLIANLKLDLKRTKW